MANSEEGKPCKVEEPSSPAKEHYQSNAHVYPDWGMMQAYYGPQFTLPPYLNSAVASPHIPPPYMWMVPPQYMVPPYGASHPGYYSHEGVYGGVSMAGTSFSMATPAESSGNTGGGLVKKSKDAQGLAVSIGNGNADGGEHGPDRRLSERSVDAFDSEVTDDSGINGVKAEAGRSGMKRRRAGSPKSAKGGKDPKKGSAGVGRGYKSVKVETSCPGNTPVKTVESTSTALESKDPSILDVKPVATYKPRSSTANEARLQDKPNVPEVKWEKRKQSNRESARRSRLRKMAEAEELATTVQTLITENMALKSELSEFMNFSKKLELENGALMERLKDARPGEVDFGVRPKPVDTVNLLARVESKGSAEGTDEEDGDSYEQRSPAAKLHQLLNAS